MREINFQIYPHTGEASIGCVKEFILAQIIFWIEPFLFQFSPKGFGNIQMWRIRRQKENVQSSFLPIGYPLLDNLRFMYSRIIQNYTCCFTYFKRKFFQIFQNKSCVDIFFAHQPSTMILSADEPQTINLKGFFGEDTNFLIRELPSIRNIAFTAHMRFIPVIKVYCLAKAQLFKFFELFNLQLVMFRDRATFWAASYTLISSAKLFKKLLKVLLHTFFPLCRSHSALAVCIRCRLALRAERIASLSCSSMVGLRPRPGLVNNPCKPSVLYRLTHVSTLTLHMPTMMPTSWEVRPSDFNNILWQRIRKQWLLPFLNPDSNSLRCSEVRQGVFTRPIMGHKDNKII